ncbi:GNAT family N-acetyltransferase [Neomicrococcus lactis]|uniref:RimJ/RimL family protein N-acetyltransferase n=1 Tax=Neomicrococcus lactis TaxID=732241 RepID=A0A7W8YAR2_9MICC|nr:GNAT family N-acetyltransferase [Neomicrococcus lactis]MBB5598088.1 RimJ/RimL family protein N-acetyltransferase [Neomicrococcus lactis]
MKLREVQSSDLESFFEHQQDPEAMEMAAFTAKNPADRGVFNYHWSLMLKDPETFIRTIEVDGEVAGNIVAYPYEDAYEISFWTDKKYWEQGITTSAVDAFLAEFTKRPLRARVVTDNVGSKKILDRRGFVVIGENEDFANARAAVVKEYIMELR